MLPLQFCPVRRRAGEAGRCPPPMPSTPQNVKGVGGYFAVSERETAPSELGGRGAGVGPRAFRGCSARRISRAPPWSSGCVGASTAVVSVACNSIARARTTCSVAGCVVTCASSASARSAAPTSTASAASPPRALSAIGVHASRPRETQRIEPCPLGSVLIAPGALGCPKSDERSTAQPMLAKLLAQLHALDQQVAPLGDIATSQRHQPKLLQCHSHAPAILVQGAQLQGFACHGFGCIGLALLVGDQTPRGAGSIPAPAGFRWLP